jgi:hypothetical protein
MSVVEFAIVDSTLTVGPEKREHLCLKAFSPHAAARIGVGT